MADPFQDVDAAGPEFISMFAESMEVRQSDPAMERIVTNYLSRLAITDGGLIIEVGAGAGAVSRRIAAHAYNARVIGFEPSAGFVAEAEARVNDVTNLTFQQANGADLPLEDGTADAVIMHTVLSHVTEPASLVNEAARVLKPDGTLIICDADFSKATLGHFANDPLDACAREFVRAFVTDPYIVGKLRQLVGDAGLELSHFDADSRVATKAPQMAAWVEATTKGMVERGDIGQELADALMNELIRRANAGAFYGYQVFGTALANKPAK